MMKTGLIAVAAGLFVSTVAFPAMAQGGAEDIARGFVFEAKPGMATQFEEAIKLHVQWRKQNNDPWTWVWYQVVNGDNIGQYLVRSGNHRWADLDAYDAWQSRVGVSAHIDTTVSPYVESVSSSITQLNSALSRPLEDYGTITLFAVTEFDLRLPNQFIGAIAKYVEALDQGNWGRPYLWQMGANGGTTAAALVIPAENWAGLAPPAKALPEMLAEVYGEQEASDLMQQLASSIRSQTSYTLRVRPDLSLP